MKKILSLLTILIFNFIVAQEGNYEILSTSINSKFSEFGVTYSGNNSVIFASSKKDENGRRTNNRQLSLELYHGTILENGDIIQTDKFSSEINNKFFESDISFTPDFKTIYFTWNNFYSAQKTKDSAKWKTLYMFKASINKKFEISEVTPMPFNSKEYSVRSPAVSKDGKRLYFASDMRGGFGEFDIYVVEIGNGGNYSAPKNLGSAVNTKQTELFPYVDQNNTLYFSSNGHKGLGGLDIFKSEFKAGNFQQAINLPAPFNSKFDDFAYVFDNAANSGYFSSNRSGGKGDVDIYAFKEKELKCTQLLGGNISDSKTNLPIDQVVVSLFKNNQMVEKQTVSKGLGFKFKIDCKESYKIVAEKENYENSELLITSDDKNKSETTKTLKLTLIACTQLLGGNISDSKTNLPIDQVVVSLFKNNQLVEKQIISKGLGFKFKIDCKENYKIVAEKENYENGELLITSDDKNKSETTKTLKLTPIACTQLLGGIVTDSETNLPLPNAILYIYHGNDLLETLNLDANAAFKYKLTCGAQYRIKASLKNYHDAVSMVKSSEKSDDVLNMALKLESAMEFISVREQKMIKTKAINFDIDESEITKDAAIELNKVVTILKKYPNLKIEIKSHTDSRATADYNMKLSNKRAQSVIAYIIANDIDQSRVSGRGYGETQLLNKCVKGVKCSEAEHQLNRRTEFIITGE